MSGDGADELVEGRRPNILRICQSRVVIGAGGSCGRHLTRHAHDSHGCHSLTNAVRVIGCSAHTSDSNAFASAMS